jgi:O86/O127-antigen biosynthesis beta-1,3-galactosyltransferase
MVSILLATYNGEKYLKDSINSILSQTFKEFELLIGLNGTTDNSRDILNPIKDSRVKIFDYGSDKGRSKTLNKLLKESKYSWVGIQDDDDIWTPNKIEKQIKYTIDYDVIGTFIKYIDSNNNIIGKPKIQSDPEMIKKLTLNRINQIANSSAIFKKESAIEVGGWNENIDGIEDLDFWIRLIRVDKKFINIPEYLVLHRLHEGSNFNTKKYDLNKII